MLQRRFGFARAVGLRFRGRQKVWIWRRIRMKVKVLDENCVLTKGYVGDAGWDLRAAEGKVIRVLETVVIGTGVCVEIPDGYSGDVRPRSSFNKMGIYCAYGTVDFGYTGEIKVALTNLSNELYVVKKYDRIAQLVVNKISEDNTLEFAHELEVSARGDKGFGSTGR
jgi:dUTP pyrophosphatase